MQEMSCGMTAEVLNTPGLLSTDHLLCAQLSTSARPVSVSTTFAGPFARHADGPAVKDLGSRLPLPPSSDLCRLAFSLTCRRLRVTLNQS